MVISGSKVGFFGNEMMTSASASASAPIQTLPCPKGRERGVGEGRVSGKERRGGGNWGSDRSVGAGGMMISHLARAVTVNFFIQMKSLT